MTESGNPGSEGERIAHDRETIEAHEPLSSLSLLMRASAARYADRRFWASLDGERSMTYAEFDQSVDRFAGALAQAGVRSGMHVGIMMGNGIDTGLLWTALSRINAVAVGMHIGLTAGELQYLIPVAHIEKLIVETDCLESVFGVVGLALGRSDVIAVGHNGPKGVQTLAELLDRASTYLPPDRPDADGPGAILFTSGSSGRPKPALLPNQWQPIMGHVRSRQGPPVARTLIETPLYYMGGQWRLAMAMTQGAAVFVTRQPSIKKFLERAAQHHIEFASMGLLVARTAAPAARPNLHFKWLASTGLPKDLHEKAEALVNAPVCETYGSTEMGSAIVMPAFVRSMVGTGSTGFPSAWKTCRIVDGEGEEVRQGDVGELEVRGRGMLLEYFNSPEETRSAFRGDWFRTGDAFCQDRNGFFYWQHRMKDIIRRSNENISAPEIEDVVSSMPGVLQVAAVPVPDQYRGEEIKIYVQLREGMSKKSVTPADILDYCRKRLARFKIPRYIEYISEFPMTVSQKIAKPVLKSMKPDLTVGSYDSEHDTWR